MKKTEEHIDSSANKKSIFEYFTEVMGWLQIFASPFLIGSIIGAIVYFSKPNSVRLIIAILIGALGLVIGIIWATRVWRKKGTIHYVSRIMATPEFDNYNNEDQK